VRIIEVGTARAAAQATSIDASAGLDRIEELFVAWQPDQIHRHLAFDEVTDDCRRAAGFKDAAAAQAACCASLRSVGARASTAIRLQCGVATPTEPSPSARRSQHLGVLPPELPAPSTSSRTRAGRPAAPPREI